MSEYTSIYRAYLESLPPLFAVLTLVGVVGWRWWANKKADDVGTRTLSSVSLSFESLSKQQQARITQQDTQIARLEQILCGLETKLDEALGKIDSLTKQLTQSRTRR